MRKYCVSAVFARNGRLDSSCASALPGPMRHWFTGFYSLTHLPFVDPTMLFRWQFVFSHCLNGICACWYLKNDGTRP